MTACLFPGDTHKTPCLCFPALLPALSLRLSPAMLANTCKPATRHFKLLPLAPCAPSLLHYAALLIHRFQSVSQPQRINPSLSCLPSPQLSLTLYPYTSPSFSFHIPFSPSQPDPVSEFPPQCSIPFLINRYAGMIGTGHQAVFIILESYWITGYSCELLIAPAASSSSVLLSCQSLQGA